MNIASQPRILIYPSVGPGYGIGNLMRCICIHRYLKKKSETIFAIDPTPIVNNICGDLFPTISAADIENDIKNFDAVLFDHQGPVDFEPNFKRYHELCPGIPIIALDYFYLDSKEVEVFINLTDYCVTQFSENPGQRYLKGLSFGIIRPEFKRKKNANSRRYHNHILITFGGEDEAGWTLTAIKWLESIIKTPRQVTVVLGKLNRQRNVVDQFMNGPVKHDYSVLSQVDNIEDYMLKCDIAFCGGGTTLLELAYLGKPAIVLPQNNMEQNLVLAFENYGYLIPDGQDSIRKTQPGPYMRLFNDSLYREKIGRLGQKLIDGKGTEKIAKTILATAISYKAKSGII